MSLIINHFFGFKKSRFAVFFVIDLLLGDFSTQYYFYNGVTETSGHYNEVIGNQRN